MKRMRVRQTYKAMYDDPIDVKAGDIVRHGRNDDEWPMYCWCAAQDGKEGWVPEELFSREGKFAVMRQDYSAKELCVSEGEFVQISRVLGGWAWAENEEGRQGWVPLNSLSEAGD